MPKRKKKRKKKKMYSNLCLRHILKDSTSSELVSIKRTACSMAGLSNSSVQKLESSPLSHCLPVQSREKNAQWEVHPIPRQLSKRTEGKLCKGFFFHYWKILDHHLPLVTQRTTTVYMESALPKKTAGVFVWFYKSLCIQVAGPLQLQSALGTAPYCFEFEWTRYL